MPNDQLKKLAKKIPDRYIGDNGRKMPAADHTVITQLLLQYVGPYSFEIKEIVRGGTKKSAGANVVTGVIGRLTATVDGREVTVEEAGGVENAENQDGDGERLKHASSDAIKRCAMRLGLGLHIWAQDMYFLDRSLERQEAPEKPEVDEPSVDPGSHPAVAQGAAGRVSGGQKANRSNLQVLREAAIAARGQDGVDKLEEYVGKELAEFTKQEVEEWTGRMVAVAQKNAAEA